MKSLANMQRPNLAPRTLQSLRVDSRVGDAGATKLIRSGVFLVGAAMAAFIGWSAVTEVNETAVTVGSVVPAGNVVPVQHLEGGIIQATLVKEGQLVEMGQPIVILTATDANANLEQMRTRLVGLMLEEERLRALVDDRSPVFDDVPEKFWTLRSDQEVVLASQIAARDGQRDVLATRIREVEAQLEIIIHDIRNAEVIAGLLSDEMEIRDELTRKGLSPRITALATSIELADAKGRLKRLQNEKARLEESIRQAREELSEFTARFRSDALVRAGAVASERAEIEEMVASLEDRVERLTVTAPIRGIVQSLPARNPGTVLPPGGLVGELVPVDEDLLVENRISPRDVGFVDLGQAVKVKVHTYDFTRLGTVPGELIYVSATTMLDENNEPYYQGRVKLAQNYVGAVSTQNVLLPGMTVQADIATGRKTILQYLLKPIYTTVDQAMTER